MPSVNLFLLIIIIVLLYNRVINVLKLILFLLIQTDVAPAKPYPVMFYIHGGDFVHGSSNSFNGHMMAAFYNVVVVAINYRLGALGR